MLTGILTHGHVSVLGRDSVGFSMIAHGFRVARSQQGCSTTLAAGSGDLTVPNHPNSTNALTSDRVDSPEKVHRCLFTTKMVLPKS